MKDADQTNINAPGCESQKTEDNDNVYHLFTKHDLYADIWMVLNMFPEMNVTEISKLVKQSKSTVSRNLNEMEHDGFVLGREKETPIPGRIPSKCYRINPDAFKGWSCSSQMAPPADPVKRLEYIKAEIHMYQYDIYEIHKMLDYMNKVMSSLSNECTSVEKADEIFNTYLSGKFEPFFSVSFHNEKEFADLMMLINEFLSKKRGCCGSVHDPEAKGGREYSFFLGTMPLRAFFERLAKKGRQEAQEQ